VRSQFVQNIPKQTGILVNCSYITINVNKDLRESLTKAISDRDFYKEILDATMKDFDKMGRTYEAELTTLLLELTQRGQIPSATEAECTQLRSRVTSLESELADLTQRFTILG